MASDPPSSTSPVSYDFTTTRLPPAEYEAVKALRKAVRAEVRAAAIEAQTDHDGSSVWALTAEDLRRYRRAVSQRHRIALLAWAYVRGIPYRRLEPCRSMQVVGIAKGAVVRLGADQPRPASYLLPVHTFGRTMQTEGISFCEHHRPDVDALHAFLVRFIPDLAIDRLDLWLHEPPKATGPNILAKVAKFADRRERQGKPATVDLVMLKPGLDAALFPLLEVCLPRGTSTA